MTVFGDSEKLRYDKCIEYQKWAQFIHIYSRRLFAHCILKIYSIKRMHVTQNTNLINGYNSCVILLSVLIFPANL
jgi:hypothetical protein